MDYLDIDFGNVDGDNFHVYGFVYLSDDGTDKPYRSVEFCGCYIPLDKRNDESYVNKAEAECKQYIEDCTEERAMEIINWYLQNCEVI